MLDTGFANTEVSSGKVYYAIVRGQAQLSFSQAEQTEREVASGISSWGVGTRNIRDPENGETVELLSNKAPVTYLPIHTSDYLSSIHYPCSHLFIYPLQPSTHPSPTHIYWMPSLSQDLTTCVGNTVWIKWRKSQAMSRSTDCKHMEKRWAGDPSELLEWEIFHWDLKNGGTRVRCGSPRAISSYSSIVLHSTRTRLTQETESSVRACGIHSLVRI